MDTSVTSNLSASAARHTSWQDKLKLYSAATGGRHGDDNDSGNGDYSLLTTTTTAAAAAAARNRRDTGTESHRNYSANSNANDSRYGSNSSYGDSPRRRVYSGHSTPRHYNGGANIIISSSSSYSASISPRRTPVAPRRSLVSPPREDDNRGSNSDGDHATAPDRRSQTGPGSDVSGDGGGGARRYASPPPLRPGPGLGLRGSTSTLRPERASSTPPPSPPPPPPPQQQQQQPTQQPLRFPSVNPEEHQQQQRETLWFISSEPEPRHEEDHRRRHRPPSPVASHADEGEANTTDVADGRLGSPLARYEAQHRRGGSPLIPDHNPTVQATTTTTTTAAANTPRDGGGGGGGGGGSGFLGRFLKELAARPRSAGANYNPNGAATDASTDVLDHSPNRDNRGGGGGAASTEHYHVLALEEQLAEWRRRAVAAESAAFQREEELRGYYTSVIDGVERNAQEVVRVLMERHYGGGGGRQEDGYRYSNTSSHDSRYKQQQRLAGSDAARETQRQQQQRKEEEEAAGAAELAASNARLREQQQLQRQRDDQEEAEEEAEAEARRLQKQRQLEGKEKRESEAAKAAAAELAAAQQRIAELHYALAKAREKELAQEQQQTAREALEEKERQYQQAQQRLLDAAAAVTTMQQQPLLPSSTASTHLGQRSPSRGDKTADGNTNNNAKSNKQSKNSRRHHHRGHRESSSSSNGDDDDDSSRGRHAANKRDEAAIAMDRAKSARLSTVLDAARRLELANSELRRTIAEQDDALDALQVEKAKEGLSFRANRMLTELSMLSSNGGGGGGRNRFGSAASNNSNTTAAVNSGISYANVSTPSLLYTRRMPSRSPVSNAVSSSNNAAAANWNAHASKSAPVRPVSPWRDRLHGPTHPHYQQQQQYYEREPQPFGNNNGGSSNHTARGRTVELGGDIQQVQPRQQSPYRSAYDASVRSPLLGGGDGLSNLPPHHASPLPALVAQPSLLESISPVARRPQVQVQQQYGNNSSNKISNNSPYNDQSPVTFGDDPAWESINSFEKKYSHLF